MIQVTAKKGTFRKPKNFEEMIFCGCGCGQLRNRYNAKSGVEVYFIQGHQHRVHPRRYGEKASGWKGGITITSRGYRMIKKPDHPRADKRGYVKEEVLVMEQYLGRYLTKQEVVHHINHDKLDNRIENLQLFSSHAEHISKGHNRREEMEKRRCCMCDAGQTRKASNGSPIWFRGPSEGLFMCGKCYDDQRYDKVRKRPKGQVPAWVGSADHTKFHVVDMIDRVCLGCGKGSDQISKLKCNGRPNWYGGPIKGTHFCPTCYVMERRKRKKAKSIQASECYQSVINPLTLWRSPVQQLLTRVTP